LKPNHLGIILDGNRRWAVAQGKTKMAGHMAGYKNFYTLSRYALIDQKIPYVSAFVFSTENWQRTKEEVGYLMRLVTRALTEFLEDFHRGNIRILVAGSRDGLDDSVLEAIEKAETQTSGNTGGNLVLCFNYGGQAEIVQAARNIIEQKIDPKNLTIDTFAEQLYKPEVPALDFVIRTSGEHRLSGFMLWRSAYAELYFTDKMWPDFTTKDLDIALEEYAHRQRRYGK